MTDELFAETMCGVDGALYSEEPKPESSSFRERSTTLAAPLLTTLKSFTDLLRAATALETPTIPSSFSSSLLLPPESSDSSILLNLLLGFDDGFC
jgi:hypothetical protein